MAIFCDYIKVDSDTIVLCIDLFPYFVLLLNTITLAVLAVLVCSTLRYHSHYYAVLQVGRLILQTSLRPRLDKDWTVRGHQLRTHHNTES